MIEFTTPTALRESVRAHRSAGRRIGLVPTMGALHEGHLALVDEARRRADVVVVSIFVNPLQFGPNEDYHRYPRDLPQDRQLAAGRGVNALFLPDIETMYPSGSETRVVPGATGEHWEGAARPGHFAGVLTVVAKLFNVVEPDLACFGQKDIQQATLVRRMVRDLDWPIELAIVPTVREPDGLALSSRNAYLRGAERQAARSLSAGLRAAAAAWQGGERCAERLEAIARAPMEVLSEVTVEYIGVVEPEGLTSVSTAGVGTIITVAARVGQTRLIDNLILGQEPP